MGGREAEEGRRKGPSVSLSLSSSSSCLLSPDADSCPSRTSTAVLIRPISAPESITPTRFVGVSAQQESSWT